MSEKGETVTTGGYEELDNKNSPDYTIYPPEPNYQASVEFSCLMQEAELAIEHGLPPVLSKQGSSGCYFVRSREDVSIEAEIAVLVVNYGISNTTVLEIP